MNTINICKALGCYWHDPSNGCQRYAVASHCHNTYLAPGLKRKGVLVEGSQYSLIGNADTVNMADIESSHKTFIGIVESDRMSHTERLKA